jgi:hypothetical protein
MMNIKSGHRNEEFKTFVSSMKLNVRSILSFAPVKMVFCLLSHILQQIMINTSNSLVWFGLGKLLLTTARTIILGSKSRGTHDHAITCLNNSVQHTNLLNYCISRLSLSLYTYSEILCILWGLGGLFK